MSSSPEQQTVCSISYLKKRPDITHEQFYHHWEKVHGPLVKPWMEKHGVLSYTQIHATPALNTNTTPVGPETGAANPLADYDGAAVIEIASMDKFAAAFQDEYYKNVIAEDEKKFLDKKAGVLRTRGETKRIVKLL